MARIREVTDFLEQIAPLHLQEDYDNAGLITGSPEWEVQGVLCALDCTPAVIEEAIQSGCNMVVSHHPIVFQGLKKLSGDTYIQRAVIQAIRHDVAIYAIHTNLDNVLQNGVNQRIAERIELEKCRILDPRDESGEIGAGLVGELRNGMKPDDFLSHLQTRFELEIIRYTPVSENRNLQRIAVCGGSGSFLLEKAILANADAFVTSDFKYHQFFDADNRIMVLDIGHYESEKFTIQLLFELISNNFSNFAAQMTKVNTNPVRYFK